MWAMWPEHWVSRYEVLLDTAKRLRDDGHHEAAIVTAQIACEVCAETTLSALFRRRGVSYLTDPVGEFILSYNLANEKVRDLYVAVSGDRIQDESFWASFKQHSKRRNDIVHRGADANLQDANESIEATEAVVRHLLRSWR